MGDARGRGATRGGLEKGRGAAAASDGSPSATAQMAAAGAPGCFAPIRSRIHRACPSGAAQCGGDSLLSCSAHHSDPPVAAPIAAGRSRSWAADAPVEPNSGVGIPATKLATAPAARSAFGGRAIGLQPHDAGVAVEGKLQWRGGRWEREGGGGAA